MAKRELTDQEKSIVQSLSDKYDGLIKTYLVKDRLVVVRGASPGDLHRYKDQLSKSFAPSKRGPQMSAADAERTLALSSIVHPEDKAEVKALLDARPGFVGTAATAAEDLASEGVEELEGN